MLDAEESLFRTVHGFSGLPLDKFEVKFAEDVNDPENEVCTYACSVNLSRFGGLVSVWCLKGGLSVVTDRKGLWYLFETRTRVEDREYYASWASFARGTWVMTTPSLEGTYPVRDLERRRQHDRTLRFVSGRLVDVTRGGGFVGSNKTTEWRGWWWSAPYPRLRGAL